MKPAFSYYGGKQRMAPKILPLIPKHTVYVEPFAGGAAVFFAKPWPGVTNTDNYREVLNDLDGRIVNFYKVLRDNPDALIRACCLTPYAREEHTKIARQAVEDDTEMARRWFVDIQQSFANKSRGGWGTGCYGRNLAATWQGKCARLYACAERLHSVHIEHDDALKVIERWDSPQTFFYCDPPYPGADQGHYKGYSQQDLDALVSALDNAQGSFLLSCYANASPPSDWERFELSAYITASGKGKTGAGRDKSRKAAQIEIGDRVRTEVVWRRLAKGALRPELQKVYDSGQLDCFTGET